MAARYWIGTGTGNFNSTTNWSATSGGATGASVPTSADDTFFDANGNNNATVSATITVKSMTIDAGYTATMTHNAVLTIAGNVTLGANYTIAGSSGITWSQTGTWTSNGKTWPNSLTLVTGGVTKTIADDFTVTGTFTVGNGTTTIQLNGNLILNGLFQKTQTTVANTSTGKTITCNNGIAMASTGLSGTAKINIFGGTWSSVSGTIQNNVDIDGNVTISGNVYYNTGTITYLNTTGTVTTTSSTLNIASGTLNTNGISWNNVNFTSTGAAPTITINSLLTALNTLSINGGNIFTGTHGFTCGNFTSSNTATITVTLQESITYTITSSLDVKTSRVGAVVLFTSSHASNKAILTLQEGATCQCLANFTRIDASGGRVIRSFNSTITDCNNIVSFYDLKTVAG